MSDALPTLTNAAPTGPPPNAYVFHPDNMNNTTVRPASADSKPLYTITSSDHRAGIVTETRTHVNDAHTGRQIATITRRDLFPDTITFGSDGHPSPDAKPKPISVRKWLRKHTLPDGYPAHAMQTAAGNQWVWKSDATHRLGLYQGDPTQPQSQCIAYLESATSTHPLTLFLDSIAEPSRDEVLVACLILEQRLRGAERNISVGGGKFEQNKTVLGHYVHA